MPTFIPRVFALFPLLLSLAAPALCADEPGPKPFQLEEGFTLLFPEDGVPNGWTVRRWDDVARLPDQPVAWEVRDGVLHGGEPRGSWLLSEKTYGDFELRYDFRLSERGNSGCALRAPLKGDPAFDGLEFQMADFRYNTAAQESELTGGLYRAEKPGHQVYDPEAWNRVTLRLEGSRFKATMNGALLHDRDLNDSTVPVTRHNGEPAPPLKDRPRSGHIGFQELSRTAPVVRIRHARIKELTPAR